MKLRALENLRRRSAAEDQKNENISSIYILGYYYTIKVRVLNTRYRSVGMESIF
jgi:hypothetical protein